MMHNHCILAFWVIITQFILKTKHCIYFTVYRDYVFWWRILLPLGKHISYLYFCCIGKTINELLFLNYLSYHIKISFAILLWFRAFHEVESLWYKKEKEHCSPVKNTGKQCSLFSFRRYEAYDFKGVCFNICYKAT